MATVTDRTTRRTAKVRRNIKRAANGRARLSVFRSSKHIYAQVIDDGSGVTLVSASTASGKEGKSKKKTGGNLASAKEIGKGAGVDLAFMFFALVHHERTTEADYFERLVCKSIRDASLQAKLGGTINVNVFQDNDYMLGSVTNPDPGVRRKAVDHLLECVDIMDQTGSRDLKLWFSDGTNYPGQDSIRARQDRLTDEHILLQGVMPWVTGAAEAGSGVADVVRLEDGRRHVAHRQAQALGRRGGDDGRHDLAADVDADLGRDLTSPDLDHLPDQLVPRREPRETRDEAPDEPFSSHHIAARGAVPGCERLLRRSGHLLRRADDGLKYPRAQSPPKREGLDQQACLRSTRPVLELVPALMGPSTE